MSPSQQTAHGRAPLLSPKCRVQGRTGGCWASEHPEGFGGFGDALEKQNLEIEGKISLAKGGNSPSTGTGQTVLLALTLQNSKNWRCRLLDGSHQTLFLLRVHRKRGGRETPPRPIPPNTGAAHLLPAARFGVCSLKKRTVPSASTAAQKIAQPARFGEKFPKIHSSYIITKRETKPKRGAHLPRGTAHQQETDALTQVVCSKKKRKTTQLGSSPGFFFLGEQHGGLQRGPSLMSRASPEHPSAHVQVPQGAGSSRGSPC